MPRRLELDDDRIIELYRSGKSPREIAPLFGCDKSVIFNRVKSAGAVRSVSDWRRRDRFNEHFFDEIDTEEKAYWLGFLLADGCVRTGSKSLQINLNAGDRPHLEKFRDAIASTAKIGFSSHPMSVDGIASLTVTSKSMTDRLRELGIIANAKRCVPPSVPSLVRHFWRGCIDGDGTLTISRCRRKCGWEVNQPVLSLVGTQETIEMFSRYANTVCGTAAIARKRPAANIWIVQIHGPLAKKMADHLWSGATICLDRKQDIQRSFEVTRDRKGESRQAMLDRILALQATGLTQRQVGIQLGMTEDAVGLRLRRAGIKTPRIYARGDEWRNARN